MKDHLRFWLLFVAAATAGFRLVLLALQRVPFDGDEAIVALMARHILQGERPWFFYGQNYMGSLDAYFIAGAFALLGESVWAVRLVQVALCTATTLVLYAVARRLTDDHAAARAASLLWALPPLLLTVYTTVSLGGYGEMMLIGSLLVWWGHRLGGEDRRRWGLWLGWGLIAGLGFWVLALVVVYLAPTALWLLWQHARPANGRLRSLPWPGYLLATAGFALGSLPWWLGQGYVAFAGLVDGAAGDPFLAAVGMRLRNFFVLGLPALFGLRFPWSVSGPPLWMGAPVLALYLGALGYALRRARSGMPLSGRLLLWGIAGALFLGFTLTPYGGDPSGRYFLPLYLPLFIFVADVLSALQRRVGRLAWLPLVILLAFHLFGTVQAARTYPPGISAHFNPDAWVDHRCDQALIAFLQDHDGSRGYANYWISYPIAFLSGEEVILEPRLPYKSTLRYNPGDNRYAPYGEQVEASVARVYVTTDYPPLNALLRERFAALGVGYRETEIGRYHVFYGFSRLVTPDELNLELE
ncbi:MAG: glycosyltransferase family 39 protein [Anaerolineae bacterium]|nr:glycosyltransferase family 39 protein [Anaerolineae bacterium]